MRARRTIRVPTAAKVAVGASILVFPATAVAAISDNPLAGAAPAGALHDVHTTLTGYGARTLVRGSAPVSDAGTRLNLEYRPAGATRWRTIDRGAVGRRGRFTLVAHVQRSGALQVQPAATAPAATTSGTASGSEVQSNRISPTITGLPLSSATTTASPSASVGQLTASPISHISVRPRLKLAKRTGQAIAGRPTVVRGRLLPGVAGRRVVLEVRRAGRWHAVAAGRTHNGGTFAVRYTPASGGPELTRVAFRGDRLNTKANSGLETVSEMQYAEVSWYDDAGNTACGFHATYGIASRTLPCGSHVTLSYGGRTVTATVDDRGPFVYSRLYDLNQTTAGALGMDGVATVLASS